MKKKSDELKTFNTIVAALRDLEVDRAEAVINSVLTFLDLSLSGVAVKDRVLESEPSSQIAVGGRSDVSTFSEDRSLSAKQFILQKQPRTDVERIACLAYYLTHYRETPHFKTIDLSKLNTEAAQPKFSNPALSAGNAVNTGYLAPATKGQRQLSAAGEIFVTNLPDREAARHAMAAMVRRRKSGRKVPRARKRK